MILMFGPAGAGKSLQGQFLALRHKWTWLSAGQILRDNNDPEANKIMATGSLLPPEMVNKIILSKLDNYDDLSNVILDGYPRSIEQATALSDYTKKRLGREGVSVLIAIDVPDDEIVKRLMLRGRSDDNEKSIRHRLEIYRSITRPLLDYYASAGIKVDQVNGNGLPGAIFDRIDAVVSSHKFTENE